MSSVSEVFQTLAESVSYYSHTEAVLTRLHKSGWIEQIVELFSDIKQEEEKFAKRELKKIQRTAGQGEQFNIREQLALNSKIFKNNFALIVGNIVNTLWEAPEPDAPADQSLSKSSAGKSSQLENQDNFESVRGSEKQQDRSVRNFIPGSFRKDQQRDDSKLLESKDSRSEMTDPKHKQPATTAAIRDSKKDIHHKDQAVKTPAVHTRPDKKDAAPSTAAAHRYNSHRTPVQVPQPQVLKVKASAMNNRDTSSEYLPQKPELIGQPSKSKYPVASLQADTMPSRRLASPRHKKQQEKPASKASALLVPDSKKVIRGSRSLERPIGEQKDTPEPKEDYESKQSSASKHHDDRFSEHEAVRLGTEADSPAQEPPQQHRQQTEDLRSSATGRRSRSPQTDSDTKKAEEEFNRRLVISVKKKLLGNTGPLDVS